MSVCTLPTRVCLHVTCGLRVCVIFASVQLVSIWICSVQQYVFTTVQYSVISLYVMTGCSSQSDLHSGTRISPSAICFTALLGIFNTLFNFVVVSLFNCVTVFVLKFVNNCFLGLACEHQCAVVLVLESCVVAFLLSNFSDIAID